MLVRNVGGRLVDIPDSIIEKKNLLGRQMVFTPTKEETESYNAKEEAVRQRQVDKVLSKTTPSKPKQ